MSSSAPLPDRRGLISCLHCPDCCRTDDKDASLLSDQDLPQAIYKLIVSFYDEAFQRLPTEGDTMPDLLGLLTTGGFCFGLLDPVSNIILNTIALLPKDAAVAAPSSSPPAAKRSKSTRWSKPRPGSNPWHVVATMSYQSLLAFLMAYFGCLTKVQATRYLYRAGANLLLAVMLVEHDLYYAEGEGALDPQSDRTQAALKWAATTIGHPSPSTLTQLMAVRLKKGDFDLLQKQFSADGRGTPLTAEDIGEIHRILHMMMSPMCVANIGHTRLMMSPYTAHDDDKLQDCLRIADGQRHILKTPCGHDCNYLLSLMMCLHGMIHNFYVKALKLLPTPSGSLMRSILKAGHCYGSMDPVSNIIVNSIWYDACGSILPLSDREKFAEYNDVLDPLSLLRLVVRSLEGLAELAVFADPQSSITCALGKLCSAKCVIDDMLSSAREGSDTNPFHQAAMAVGHPLPLQLGELHRLLLLMPDERSTLLSFINEARTSGGVLNVDAIMLRMTAMWSNRSGAKTSGAVQAPELCEEALRVVLNKRLQYEKQRSWLRSKLERVLQDYTDKHFWEQCYKLDIIFGVEESDQGDHPFADDDTCYHVNFLATSNLKLQRTLFFAELWSSPEPKPEFCCPLPYAYAGRCYSGVHSARKIVYPDDAKYIPDDITEYGTGGVDGMLEMDLVYFSSELDVELAENLNKLPSSESADECECDC